MTVRVWYLTAWYRFRIKFFSKRHLEKGWGVQGEESPMEVPQEFERYMYLVAWQVEVSCRRIPWTPGDKSCLVKALTARRLLMRKGISCTLYLGVKKDEKNEMAPHAWLRSGEHYITGGNGEEYAMVAKFRS